jgi:hypothetical protein
MGLLVLRWDAGWNVIGGCKTSGLARGRSRTRATVCIGSTKSAIASDIVVCFACCDIVATYSRVTTGECVATIIRTTVAGHKQLPGEIPTHHLRAQALSSA